MSADEATFNFVLRFETHSHVPLGILKECGWKEKDENTSNMGHRECLKV